MRLQVLALTLLLLPLGVAAQSFSSLEERMSHAEFKAAGLDKLSSEELARLNAWLRERIAATAAATSPATLDRRGFRDTSPSDPDLIVSRIPGSFTGWGGGSRLELENGQVWEVERGTDPLAVRLDNPTVTIKKGFMNAWFLRVEGYNASAKVKRVR